MLVWVEVWVDTVLRSSMFKGNGYIFVLLGLVDAEVEGEKSLLGVLNDVVALKVHHEL